MNRARYLLTCSALALTLACGDDDEHKDPPPTPSAGFAVSAPERVSVTVGGTRELTVAVQRTASSVSEILLELVGRPPGLSGTFATPSLVADSTSLTLTASAQALVGTYPVWVRGTAGGKAVTAALLVDVVPAGSMRTVRGLVVDAFRQPLSGVAIHAGDYDVATDGEGVFDVQVSGASYNLVARRYAPSALHVFVGLTRSDPEIMLADVDAGLGSTSDVSGTLSGPSPYPQSDAQVSVVAFAAEQGYGSALLFPGQGPAYGPLSARWFGAETVQGQLVALQWEVDAALFPDHFIGLSVQDVTLSAGTPYAAGTATLQPLGTGFLSGEIVPASGHTVTLKTAWLEVGPWTGVLLAYDASDDASFTYGAPDAHFSVGVQAVTERSGRSSAIYRSGLAPSEIVELSPPASPTLTTPANAASVSRSPAMTFTAYAGAIHVVTLTPTAAATVRIYTTATSVDLAALGVSLEAATGYQWGVTGVGPYASLDDYVAPGTGGVHFVGLGHDILWGQSELRALTTN